MLHEVSPRDRLDLGECGLAHTIATTEYGLGSRLARDRRFRHVQWSTPSRRRFAGVALFTSTILTS
ncbi:hypothetical protein BQ8420_10825 [Nocardiopsis sp. JB363]|nr:hypothetical protein BQ8420_10825 [Nocardiopsis sp. JB363]